jgi:hypothetical protein
MDPLSTGSEAVGTVTNEVLAAILRAQHEEVTRRIDELTEQVRETNGRLRKAELSIAVLELVRSTPTSMPSLSAISAGKVATGIAVAGAAVWGVVQVLFKVGDALRALGMR